MSTTNPTTPKVDPRLTEELVQKLFNAIVSAHCALEAARNLLSHPSTSSSAYSIEFIAVSGRILPELISAAAALGRDAGQDYPYEATAAAMTA